MTQLPVTGVPSQHSAGLATALYERAEALVDDLLRTVAAAPKASESAWIPPPVEGRATCLANVRSLVAGMTTPSQFDPQPAIVGGADRARQRMAVLVDEAARHPNVDAQIVQDMTANLQVTEELFTAAMFTGYRDQLQRQVIEEMSQGSLMMDTLLHGHTHDRWRLWEIANFLRLPTEGPFTVIAAELDSVGNEVLPDIGSKLRSLDVFSAWRLLPDLQVGVAHVASERHRETLVALLTRMATRRIGVSACFDDLRDTPIALHFAKVSLRGHDWADAKVAVFDGSMLATAAVSAPSVMVKSAAVALDGFDDLPDEVREMLFDTFRAWVDNDASMSASAEVLSCHPNTVRKRLRRIEERTGRSLSRPRDVIELSLALEVHRRLM
jgi:PucR C-terminal helix-turn-helix domain/GGDEF-like domain